MPRTANRLNITQQTALVTMMQTAYPDGAETGIDLAEAAGSINAHLEALAADFRVTASNLRSIIEALHWPTASAARRRQRDAEAKALAAEAAAAVDRGVQVEPPVLDERNLGRLRSEARMARRDAAHAVAQVEALASELTAVRRAVVAIAEALDIELDADCNRPASLCNGAGLFEAHAART